MRFWIIKIGVVPYVPIMNLRISYEMVCYTPGRFIPGKEFRGISG
jgi:hypothetical protein